MHNSHYQGQLDYVRGMGRDFARIHPGTAGLLSAQGSDPDVERLLQGFAFLTGRIHERFDAAVPQVIQQLCELTAPHQLTPRPATTVVEFSPTLDGARACRRVPRATRIDAKSIDGTRCQFSTCHDLDLLPIELSGAQYEVLGSQRSRITLAIHGREAGLALCARPEAFRLFLHGERELVENIRFALAGCLRQIRVEVPATGRRFVLPPDAVRSSGFSSADAVLPWPERSPQALRTATEWLEVPENFHFIDLVGLDAIEVAGEELHIVFELVDAPEFPTPPSRQNFRLHCTPVVNSFFTHAEPVSVDACRPRSVIRAAGIAAEHMQIQSVRSVVGLRRGERQRRPYYPLHEARHSGIQDDDETSLDTGHGYYSLQRRPCPLDGGLELTLDIASPPTQAATALLRETLSIEVECSNRHLPRQLNQGDLSCSAPESRVGTACTNITRVRPPSLPNFDGNAAWSWMQFLSFGRRGDMSSESLRQWFALLDQRVHESSVQSDDNHRRRHALRSLHRAPSTRIWKGAACHGISSTVEVDETAVGGIGAAYLFGQVLDHCLSSMTPLNQLHDTQVRLHPSGRVLDCSDPGAPHA